MPRSGRRGVAVCRDPSTTLSAFAFRFPTWKLGFRAEWDPSRYSALVSSLRRELAGFDGRHTEVLESVRDARQPTKRLLRECMSLGSADEPGLAAGATWLFRAWVEGGAAVDAAMIQDLAQSLPTVSDDWARLHLCQTVRALTIPESAADAFAEFLEECRHERRPFLRAWAVDGLYRLAQQHADYGEAAEDALTAAEQDSAASVRARVRQIRKGN